MSNKYRPDINQIQGIRPEMSDKPQTTETPWIAEDRTDNGGGFSILAPHAHYSRANVAHYISGDDAALTVTAVNAHSFMTSTLIRAKKELIQLRESSTDKNFTDSVLKQIDKALRLAEGEKKCP
jgi:hypothetical protein